MGFVLLALLALPLKAQPGPPPELVRIADEVRRQPTDARSVHPRFQMIMEGVRMRGAPPPEVGRRLEDIRRLLGEGALTQAAGALDALVLDLERRRDGPAHFPPAPPPSAPAPPAAAPEPEPEKRALTVRMLSAPMPKPAIDPLEPPAEAVAPAPAPALDVVRAREPLVIPAPKPAFPWALTFVGIGVGLLGLAGLLMALRRQEAAPAKPVEPTLRQKYRVGELLASGGMGEVYEGSDLSLGRKVAIKKMLPHIKLDAGMRGQFAREARTVAKLSHPYIVQIHECLEDGEDVYLVFEYVEGEPLSRRLSREGRLPLKECKRILSFVCQAVDHAHKSHVLHRDLKPANIMLDKSGIARVMDFGIALESTRTATAAGEGFLDASGTLRYMPPEQHQGSSVRASDVYALGICLYEMATGQMPFAGGSVEELLAAKRSRSFAPPSSLVPGLPKELDVFMTAALEPDARNRVGSAAEFLELLQGLP